MVLPSMIYFSNCFDFETSALIPQLMRVLDRNNQHTFVYVRFEFMPYSKLRRLMIPPERIRIPAQRQRETFILYLLPYL